MFRSSRGDSRSPLQQRRRSYPDLSFGEYTARSREIADWLAIVNDREAGPLLRSIAEAWLIEHRQLSPLPRPGDPLPRLPFTETDVERQGAPAGPLFGRKGGVL